MVYSDQGPEYCLFCIHGQLAGTAQQGGVF